jgi:hypothetical protein
VPSYGIKVSSSAAVRRTIPAALCAVGLVSAWLAAAPGAQASTRAAAPHTVMHTAKVNAKAVLAYWTPARLRAAKSADVLVAGSRPHVLPPTAKVPGKPGRVAGGRARGQGAAATPAIRRASPNAFSYPYPYDSFTPAQGLWRTYPYEVNGKLFFSNDGGNYVCSATSVASSSGTSNENEIWTAGHCAANTNGTHRWDSSAIFIPAYNGNVANFDPFGEFVWTGAAITTTAWFSNSDLTEDEAAMQVGTSTTTGRTLGNSVGWDGFAWNYPVNQQFVAFGYPAASPYNGLNMVEDIGATAGQDGNISGANATRPIVIGNPMTGGSSGGAWNIGWTSSGPGYINGHNDYKYTNQPLAMYSPYQDTLSNTVRCFNKTSC